MAKSLGKFSFRFYIYIDWKKDVANFLLDLYIYIDWKKDVANFLLDFIYILEKSLGKSFEIHTDNYRQL